MESSSVQTSKKVNSCKPLEFLPAILKRLHGTCEDEFQARLRHVGFKQFIHIKEFLEFIKLLIDECNELCRDKRCIQSINKEESLDEPLKPDVYVTFLLDIFFADNLDDLAKNGIARYLKTLSPKTHSIITNVSNQKLKSAFLASDKHSRLAYVIRCLSTILNSVNFEVDTIVRWIMEISTLIFTAITDFMDVITQEITYQVCQSRHSTDAVLNSLRLIQQILKKFRSFNLTVHPDNLDFYPLYCLTMLCLSIKSLPMDAMHVTILLAMNLKYIVRGYEGCLQLYCDCRAKYSEENILILVASRALLSAVPITVLFLYDDVDTGLPVLEIIVNDFLSGQNRFGINSAGKFFPEAYKLMRPIANIIIQYPEIFQNKQIGRFLAAIFNFIDCFSEPIKYAAREALKIIVNNDDEYIISHCLATLNNCAVEDQSKWPFLMILCEHISVSKLLQYNRSILNELFRNLCTGLDDKTNMISTYEALMAKHYTEIKDDDMVWYKTWIRPVFEAYCNSYNSDVMESIFVRSVTICPNVTSFIQDNLTPALEEEKVCLVLKGLLELYKIRKSAGTEPRSNFYTHSIMYNTLEKCLFSYCPQVCLDAAALVVEYCNPNYPLSAMELSVLQQFFAVQLGSKDRMFRKEVIKLAERLAPKIRAVMKSLERTRQQTDPNDLPKRIEPFTDIYKCHEFFIRSMTDMCFDHLYPSASYNRRNAALSILTAFNDCQLWHSDTYRRSQVDSLFFCLSDNYEENQSMAIKLIGTLPLDEFGLYSNENMTMIVDAIKTYSGSYNMNDNLTAAYYCHFLCLPKCPAHRLPKAFGYKIIQADSKQNHSAVLMVASGLLEHCSRKIVLVNNDITKIPPFGILSCLRYLMKLIIPKNIYCNPTWVTLINNIANACFAFCTQAQRFIMGVDTPEGHLPLSDLDQFFENEEQYRASQRYVVCGWRTLKEGCLLLSDLACMHFNILHKYQAGIMQEKYVDRTRLYFNNVMFTVKHKGVLEQVYIAYNNFCRTVCQKNIGSFREYLSEALDQVLNLVIGGSSKFNNYRRSLGITLVFQILVTMEKPDKLRVSATLRKVMDPLTKLCNNFRAPVDSKVHAYNIMRAFFKNSDLKDEMLNYIESAAQVIVRGIGSKHWSIKNASALLLSEVITRLFGVPQCSKKLGSKNRMSYYAFFEKYPDLGTILADQMTFLSTAPISLLQHQVGLIPTLLILSHLRAPGPDILSNLMKYPLFVHLALLGRCPILKVREAVSKALKPLITHELYLPFMKSSFDKVALNYSENMIHGLLLQIDVLLSNASCLHENKKELNSLFLNMIEKAESMLSARKYSFIVKDAFLLCLLKILNLMESHDCNAIQKLTDFILLFLNSELPKNFSKRNKSTDPDISTDTKPTVTNVYTTFSVSTATTTLESSTTKNSNNNHNCPNNNNNNNQYATAVIKTFNNVSNSSNCGHTGENGITGNSANNNEDNNNIKNNVDAVKFNIGRNNYIRSASVVLFCLLFYSKYRKKKQTVIAAAMRRLLRKNGNDDILKIMLDIFQYVSAMGDTQFIVDNDLISKYVIVAEVDMTAFEYVRNSIFTNGYFMNHLNDLQNKNLIPILANFQFYQTTGTEKYGEILLQHCKVYKNNEMVNTLAFSCLDKHCTMPNEDDAVMVQLLEFILDQDRTNMSSEYKLTTAIFVTQHFTWFEKGCISMQCRFLRWDMWIYQLRVLMEVDEMDMMGVMPDAITREFEFSFVEKYLNEFLFAFDQSKMEQIVCLIAIILTNIGHLAVHENKGGVFDADYYLLEDEYALNFLARKTLEKAIDDCPDLLKKQKMNRDLYEWLSEKCGFPAGPNQNITVLSFIKQVQQKMDRVCQDEGIFSNLSGLLAFNNRPKALARCKFKLIFDTFCKCLNVSSLNNI